MSLFASSFFMHWLYRYTKGYCIYHATVIAACSDIVLAATDLKYMPGLVEANLFPWASALNLQKVKEILFTQRFVLAPEALLLL